MNKIDEIKKQVKENMIEVIQSVLVGDVYKGVLLYCKPNEVIEYFESIGGEFEEDFETNGWEWDFWFSITLNDETYSFSGDGYYSDSINISTGEY